MMSASGTSIIQSLNGHKSDVTNCDFFGNYFSSCSSDKTVRLWLYNKEHRFEEVSYSPLLGHTYGVNCVRFSSFGTLLASCSTDGTVILWSVQNGDQLGKFSHISGSPIRMCAFSPSSAVLATGGDDEKIVLWDMSTKSALRVLEGHEAMITAFAFTPDSSFLASCSSGGDVMLWDARYGHGKCLLSFSDAHDLGVLGCDFSSQFESHNDGSLNSCYSFVTCGNDDLVKLWCIQARAQCTISLSRTLEGHSGNVMSCRFSADGNLLGSTAGDKTVILWNSHTGQILQKLEGHSRYVTCCAFSDNNLLATGSNDKTINIWSLDNSKLHDKLSVPVFDAGNSLNSDKYQISCWTVEDVCEWLGSIKFSEFSESFRSHAIDGKELMYLNHESLLNTFKIEALGQRNKILRSIQGLKNCLWQHIFPDNEDTIALEEFFCPITHEVMVNPVVAADGYSYESSAIKEWLNCGNCTSPMTNEVLEHKILIPNHILLSLIKKYKV